jgi:hypothetical protein
MKNILVFLDIKDVFSFSQTNSMFKVMIFSIAGLKILKKNK